MRTIVGINVLLSCLLGVMLLPICAADYETPAAIAAETLFPNIPLQSKHYTIESSVPTDGFLTRAVIKSELGDFVAIGPGMLEMRLHEIDALVKLQTFEASEEFQGGAKDSATEKWEGLKQFFENPKEAASGISAGLIARSAMLLVG